MELQNLDEATMDPEQIEEIMEDGAGNPAWLYLALLHGLGDPNREAAAPRD